jgi:hypothetical protein
MARPPGLVTRRGVHGYLPGTECTRAGPLVVVTRSVTRLLRSLRHVVLDPRDQFGRRGKADSGDARADLGEPD